MAQSLGTLSTLNDFNTLTTGYRLSVSSTVNDVLTEPVDVEYFIDEFDENTMDQPNGTLTIDISVIRGFAAGSPSIVTLTVIDNDPTEVSLIRTGSTGAIDEGQAVTFTVELGRALVAGEIIEVPLSVTGTGTDVEPADWSLSETGTGVVLSNENTMTPLLRFENAGAQTAELTLTANGDNTVEGGGSETYVIALGPDGDVPNGFDHSSLNTNVGGGADPHSGSNTFSVQVDDATLTEDPAIVLTPATAISLIEGSTTIYTVALATEPTAEVVITLNGVTTALRADTDADMVGDQNTLTFSSDNWNEAQIVTLTAGTDSNSVDETIVLTHMADSGYGSVTEEVTVTVRDADTPRLILGVNTLNVTEGDMATYTVRLGTRPGTNVTVTITGQSGDLRVDSGTELTFTQSNWNEAQIITLTAVMDSNTTNDQVTLTHTASGYSAAPVDLTVTITDSTPQLSFSQTAVSVGEGGSTSYMVRLSALPVAEVTVMLSGHASTGLSVNPLELTFSTMNWNETQVITLTAGTDSNSVNETIVLMHRADAGYGSVPEEVTVTVRDADTPRLILNTDELTVIEGGSASYTVALGTQPSGNVTVTDYRSVRYGPDGR